MPATWASAGASLLGGLFSSSSAKKAAKQQQAAAQQGLAAQREMYDIGRGDLAPYRNTGASANNRLSFLLGLEGGENPAIAQAQKAYDAAQQRYNSLAASSSQGRSGGGFVQDFDTNGDAGDGNLVWRDNLPGSGGTVDLSGARAELDAAQNALNQARGADWQTPDGFGSLNEKFYGQDLYDDPGYLFRLAEGNKGIENSAAARGMQLSGANLKGLTRFNQDYASNEFGAARSRHMGDQDQTYNYLTGVTNRGANAASASAGMAQNFGNAQANTYSDIGNARSAGTVASGNALQSGINGAYNAYQDSEATKRLNAILRGGGTDWTGNASMSSGSFGGWGGLKL